MLQLSENPKSVVFSEENYLAAKLALISSMTFLGVSYGLITLLWFFMLSDTLLGIWKAVVLGGFSAVSKTKFWSGVGTKIAILFIPLSLALTGALAGYDLNIFVLTTMWVLIANDAASCYTNLLSIKRRKHYENKDLVVWLINALRYAIYAGAKNALDKIKNAELCEDEFKDPPRPGRKGPNEEMD